MTGLALLVLMGLGGCSTDGRIPQEPEVSVTPPMETIEEAPTAPGRSVPSPEIVRTMVIADILYDASKALEDNRLMVGQDNAYDLFNQVLEMAPENEVALTGIEEIVARYVALARNAIQLGQYDQADTYLDRAASIDDGNEALQQARQTLQVARQQQGEFFSLDEEQLRDRSLTLMAELGEIGRYLRENELTFIITARTDEQARWIYKVMREAVGGYRLRGNIALGGQPGIRVRHLQTDQANTDNGRCEQEAAC